MTANEVLKLIDSGFTADEIRAMGTEAPDTQTQPDVPVDQPKEGEDKKDVTTDANLSELTDSIKELKDTVKEMQAANIDKARGGKSDFEKSIQDRIKSFTDTL